MKTYVFVTEEDICTLVNEGYIRVGNEESGAYLVLENSDEKYKELMEEDVNNAED